MFFFLAIFTATVTNPYNVSNIELEALWALWVSTDGPNWTNNSGWWTDTNVDNWNGIVINTENIDGIDLHYNNLSGSIPPELGDLSNLSYLLLKDNNLSGTIPSELFNFNLTYLHLDLRYNSLTGTVPEWICNISYVRIKEGNNSFSPPYPSCWNTLKSATIIPEVDFPEIMLSCYEEATQSNIGIENFTEFIDECVGNKLNNNQVAAGFESLETSSLKVYPIPVKKELNIEAPFETYKTSLFDFSGRKVLEQQCCGHEAISVDHLKKGIYLLVVEAEGKQQAQKISIE